MNREHAYKASIDAITAAGTDPDQAGVMTSYLTRSYYRCASSRSRPRNAVDQQIKSSTSKWRATSRSVFNHHYGETFVLPKRGDPRRVARVLTAPGLDGRKMSKSYHGKHRVRCSRAKKAICASCAST